MVRRSAALAFALAATTAAPASASPLLDLTGATNGNGGLQGVVSGPAASSTYFNPALLTMAEEGFVLGYGFVSEQMGITLDGRRAGSDVPLSVGERDIVGPDGVRLPNDRVPTQWLQEGCRGGTEPGDCPAPGLAARRRQNGGSSGKTRTYLVLGIVKHLVKDRATLGFTMMLPVSSFVTARSFYADEREALFSNSLHPELYGDRLTALSFAAGGAFQIAPNLSLGLSITLALANTATAASYVRDASDYQSLLLNTEVRTQIDVAPVLGLRWAPANDLRFGATLHAPQAFVLENTINAQLPAGSESGTTRRDVYHWMPWRVGFGAEGDVLHRGTYTMALTGSLRYGFWSAYEDRHGQRPSAYGSDLAWNDTMTVTAGVRHTWARARAFADATFVPSPVPEQTGRSSYVDNDRVGLVIGADVKIPIGKSYVRPAISLGAQRLVPRRHTKEDARVVDELPDGSAFDSTRDPVPGTSGLQTNSPGWPGFRSSGYLWQGMFTLEVPL
ncbi:MAG: hypothetical protein JST00_23310 [Deltaproteobacteria bacterium]|nr:hypothetical protein [Deltaproteobacteria bacterium]